MTLDNESLENRLRQRPPIADDGFSQTVLLRIAAQQRRRHQVLLTTWTLAMAAVVIAASTQLKLWINHLQPLTNQWTRQTEQVLHQVSDASLQLPLSGLWQSSAGLILIGVLTLLLTATVVSAWD